MFRKIDYTPFHTPRPRVFKDKITNKYRAINEVDYTEKKRTLSILLKSAFKAGSKRIFTSMNVVFALPYPKSTAKKYLIDGASHFKKPDIDNLLKGVLDALSKSKVIHDDNQICEISMKKIYTTDSQGFYLIHLSNDNDG